MDRGARMPRRSALQLSVQLRLPGGAMTPPSPPLTLQQVYRTHGGRRFVLRCWITAHLAHIQTAFEAGMLCMAWLSHVCRIAHRKLSLTDAAATIHGRWPVSASRMSFVGMLYAPDGRVQCDLTQCCPPLQYGSGMTRASWSS